MAHVLLGFHKYACDDLKSLEKNAADKNGPLGRDSLPLFKFWRTPGTVLERVVRTTSETFGPAGDHHGVRDRWEAYCTEKGIKTVIGNYRDNRFNGIFQTSAEIVLHTEEMLDVLNTVKTPNRKLLSVKADLQDKHIRTCLQCFGLFYVHVTGPYWNLVTSNAVLYLLLYTYIQDMASFLKTCVTQPVTLIDTKGPWAQYDEICDIPNRKRFEEKLVSVDSDYAVLLECIQVVSAAMLRCIERQLLDFLPGGQFSTQPSNETLAKTSYAHLTNLSCEHHFGDLDSPQRRRPNASMHHHSTVQLLKRNRTDLVEWLADLQPSHKQKLLKDARQGGRDMRATNLQRERKVLCDININMFNEKKKKAHRVKETRDETDAEQEWKNHEAFDENEYVVVAYQDTWYPGCVEKIMKETITVNFLAPTRKPGFFVWPLRKDVQCVRKEFVLSKGFIPECKNSGRQWYLPNHEAMSTLFGKYSQMYF